MKRREDEKRRREMRVINMSGSMRGMIRHMPIQSALNEGEANSDRYVE